MRLALLAPLVLLVTFTIAESAKVSPAPDQSMAKSATAVAALHALFDEAWEYRMKQFPVEASYLGDRRYADQWDKLSPVDYVARQETYQGFLKELVRIDRDDLPQHEQLNADLFDKQLATDIEEISFGSQFLAIDQRSGLQTDDELASAIAFETVADYEAWIGRLNGFSRHAADVTELLREGIKRKVLYPKVLMQRIPPQIDKQLVARPEDSPFFRPFCKFPASISQADRDRLAKAGAAAITASVIPAFTEFKNFLATEYLPACPGDVGLGHLPNGQEFYGFLARKFTTTDLTPQQIHQIGLSEVARIRTEMEKVKTAAGFKGTLDEFFVHLRTDPKYFCKTPEELLTRYRAIAKRIDPLTVKVFKLPQRAPYGVNPIPDLVAPDTTTAYYLQPAADGSRAGTYFVNLYKPETRPTWEMIPLTLHEAVPGHHSQIALAMEQDSQPNFRKYGGYTAFVEGWGLYAESLGDELGLYTDPVDKFGQLTYEMWRAVRLVVDTGLNSLGWDRQKAIDYFKANAPRSELDITNEIDRYLAMPGQALAYKMGELKIKQLRHECALALGDKFDVRDYHDFLMKTGAVPLDILERNVRAWTAARAKAEHISTIPE
ncbi:MAG TPA: DUF885 domain-containing protein [Chthoniobacterales bacterium]